MPVSKPLSLSPRTVALFVVSVLVGFGLVVGGGSVAFAGDVEGFGVVDQSSGVWYLRDPGSGETTSFFYGNPGDFPILGDWDCDGVDSPGLYRQSDGYVYLRNTNSQGVADVRFFFGDPGDVPLAGDFDDDGCDTVSIYRPSESRVFVINELGSDDGGLGAADFSYVFGNPGDKPFVGDFDGDGVDTVGLHRESTGLVYFRNSNTQGNADAQFIYGDPGDKIMAGKWTSGHTKDTVGIFRPSQGMAYLRYVNTQGNADEQHLYGNRNMLPVAGHLGTLPGGDEPPPGNPVFATAPVFAIGDSVMLGAKTTVEATLVDTAVDAVVSRPFTQADDVLAAYLATHPTPAVLIVHLGTNGPPAASSFDALMAVAKDVPRVLFVTVKLDKSWESASNAAIKSNAARFEKAELVDWHALADPHPSWFSADTNCGCHLWNGTVRAAYAGLLKKAVEEG
jgi:hypothetical protein